MKEVPRAEIFNCTPFSLPRCILFLFPRGTGEKSPDNNQRRVPGLLFFLPHDRPGGARRRKRTPGMGADGRGGRTKGRG